MGRKEMRNWDEWGRENCNQNELYKKLFSIKGSRKYQTSRRVYAKKNKFPRIQGNT